MSQLTLTLDDDLLQDAQTYAQQHGQNLNALVAELLRATVRPVPPTAGSAMSSEQRLAIIRKLAGSVRLPADSDYRKEVEEGLREKYGL